MIEWFLRNRSALIFKGTPDPLAPSWSDKQIEEKYSYVNMPQPDRSLAKAVSDVVKFHKAMDLPILNKPQFIDERADLRFKLVAEEFEELAEGVEAGDIFSIADALADLIYVCIGMALEFGIPLTAVWDEVQNSNMKKIDPATGKAVKNKLGKVQKPKGWQPPDIRGALGL